MALIIAVDFDGTLNKSASSFPHAGEPNWAVINKVKQLKEEGWELILWTCRSGKALQTAIEATEKWGLKWDAINTHTESQKEWWKKQCKEGEEVVFGNKVFANVYLDDRACNVEDFFR